MVYKSYKILEYRRLDKKLFTNLLSTRKETRHRRVKLAFTIKQTRSDFAISKCFKFLHNTYCKKGIEVEIIEEKKICTIT